MNAFSVLAPVFSNEFLGFFHNIDGSFGLAFTLGFEILVSGAGKYH